MVYIGIKRIIIVSVILGVVAFVGWCLYKDYETKQWINKHCIIVDKTSSKIGYGASPVWIPGTTIYQCDNNTTIER